MAVAPCTSTRIDTIIHNVMTNALKYQRINLASHVIYGSSRLGTKDYLPNQYYNLWDNQGPTIIVDTTQLNGRRPWYSLEYNDDIKGLYAEPWSNTDVSPFSVQHQVGQKQYELTNHLGNVQATVTDLPVLAAKTNDTIRQHHPAIAAAYDYYPFGMLMPDRYVSDTSGNCLTVTQTKWVTTYETVCHDVYDWVWPNISVIALGSFTFNTKELFFTAPRLTDGIAVSATVVPHLSHTLNLDLDLLQNEASTTRLQVTELIDGNWKEIASTSLVKGRNLVTFIPSTSTITWRILGPFYVKVNTVCITQPVLSQQSVLVDICNTDKDKYRFGFNGQEKVNEWSGVGNFNEFKERGQDTRIGRFLSVDPIAHKYPWNSPFAFAENDVIRCIDLEGLEKVIVNTNNATSETQVFRIMKLNQNKSEWEKGEYGYVNPRTGEMSIENSARDLRDQRWHDKLLRPENIRNLDRKIEGGLNFVLDHEMSTKFPNSSGSTVITVPTSPGGRAVSSVQIPFEVNSDVFQRGTENSIREMLRPLAESMRTDPSITVDLSGNTNFSLTQTDLPLTSGVKGEFSGSASELMNMRGEKVKKTLIDLGADPNRIRTSPGIADGPTTTTIAVEKAISQ